MITSTKEQVNVRAQRRLERLGTVGATGSEAPAAGAGSFSELARQRGGQVRVACDTEFEGPHTLTAQFAARVGDSVVVQVYRSAQVPEPPKDFKPNTFVPEALRSQCNRLIFRPVKPLSRKLSPVCVLADLFGLSAVETASRGTGEREIAPDEGAETLTLVLVAHHWAADLFRVFGTDFWQGLLGPGTRLGVRPHKPLGFKENSAGGRFHPPVLEYAREGPFVYSVRVRHFDTNLPFSSATLEEHARTFLDVGKVAGISQADKAHMLKTFKKKTQEAYGYAVLDAVLALLVEERMRQADAAMYQALGFDAKETPLLRPTQGGRVAELLTRAVARAANGSVELARKDRLDQGGQGLVASQQKIKELFHKGSGTFIAEEARSRFGRQTGETHGGLLFSRTPAQFFHRGRGQFRDLDLSGCYAAIIASMNLYVGRPVVWEPGSRGFTVKQAVPFLKKHAAGNDAWLMKVSGRISGMLNVLIPSTSDALTHSNYQKRAAKKRARSKRLGLPFDWLYEAGKDAGNAVLFTDVVEAGMIAWPTWLMIQAMPEEVRREYENLQVESVLFYPAKLVADSGSEYDDLVAQYTRDGPPWSGTLDLDRMEQVIVERLGDEYASLRFGVGDLARKMIQLRKEARENFGQGSSAELGWKQTANTLYGVLASRHLTTNNVVAANFITATARALAFTMQLSLNGFQVITDGCTYRRDEIPACTLAQCLAASPDYPLRRPEGKVPFLDPSTIPEDDAAFTEWYRQHVKNFLGVDGPDYDALFGLHRLEHKKCGEPARAAFDGLCSDGSANYIKLLRTDGRWKAADVKARSYRREAKKKLAPWLIRTYRKDCYEGPPPVTESGSLLTYKKARLVARQALKQLEADSPAADGEDPAEVYFPLGLEAREVQAYKIIKPSAFLFRTPEQREKAVKAMKKFEDACGCGLEALALRRSYGGRRNGSLIDVAEAVYTFIRSGGDNITRELNLTRSFQELEVVQETHLQELQERKEETREALYQGIDTSKLSKAARQTGLFVRASDIIVSQTAKAGD